MSSKQFGILHTPTNDIKQVRECLEGIECYGKADFDNTLVLAAGHLLNRPPNMNNSLLFFVASPTHIVSTLVSHYGDLFKKHGVAVNIVNLFVLEDDVLSKMKGRRGLQLELGRFKYGRRELGIFVAHANNDGNSQVLDVKDPHSVFDVISNSILKKVLYLKEKHQKDAAENVDVIQQLEPSHKESVNVKAPGIQSFKKVGQCHNEKNKGTADDEIV
uniref:uncharacterized protein LOC122586444 n=1 Tax=Erigeron canadensis TaxID=72917 RepID=UPI001CB89A7D|nr:uncharacterized protein LOC122586444 [Erigeron canadensis]XP_043614368.1 uncharacterized protein LOC122586444 [Erigeron canadensis]